MYSYQLAYAQNDATINLQQCDFIDPTLSEGALYLCFDLHISGVVTWRRTSQAD